jgi:hypothetical protein
LTPEARQASGLGRSRLVPPDVCDFLRRELGAGRMVLFTGAGFSACARDRGGRRRVPTGKPLADELWQLCFPGERRDSSTLQDLFQHPLATRRAALAALHDRRLRVSLTGLPPFYRTWFALPWRRVYTLNVDDLELAAARRFELPRRVRSLSALRPGVQDTMLRVDAGVLDVIHLNGAIDDGPEGITFSTVQYAEQLVTGSAFYSQLVRDFVRYPMLLVGTRLDESPLWQHFERAGVHAGRRRTPPGLLVTERVSRARQSLLASLDIRWLAIGVEAFATEVLAQLEDVVSAGLAALDRTRVAQRAAPPP